MPSSLTRVISLILGFSPRPPVSVYGTGTLLLDSSFSRQCEFSRFHTYFLSPSRPCFRKRYFTLLPASALGRALPSTRSTYPPVSLLLLYRFGQYRNINLLSIAYDNLVLGLGPDLPWGDEPSPGNLRLSMERILTSLSLLMPAFSLLYSPPLLSVRLHPIYDAPLPLTLPCKSIASAAGFSPGHFRRKSTRPVSYYALFE